MVCPVCNKAGLEQDALKCPQCNSDLEQFHIVNRIEKGFLSSNRKRNLSLILVCLIMFLSIAIVYFITSTRQQKADHLDSGNITDSTKLYKSKYMVATRQIDSLEQAKSFIVIHYKVRQGDNLHTLAAMFYNDVTRASDLARENGLKNPDVILIGQMLKIKVTR